jgi:hypothetical protein
MTMRPLYRTSLAGLIIAMATGCADDRPRALPAEPTEIEATALSAYMAVSDPTPPPGSRFTVAVRTKRGVAVGPVGSFTLRLFFDSTKMRFVEHGRSELGMVMANGATPGVLTAAGASSNGFTNDELLLATFTAIGPDPVSTLTFSVTELNSVSFENHRNRLIVSPAVVRDNRLRK